MMTGLQNELPHPCNINKRIEFYRNKRVYFASKSGATLFFLVHTLFCLFYRALSRKYLANVSEVLDGVQKMEESLRRLKRGRDKQQNANISSAPTPGGGGQENTKSENKEKGVSDDDKIRLQLFVDVKHYIQTIKSLGVNVDSITDVSLKSFFKSI